MAVRLCQSVFLSYYRNRLRLSSPRHKFHNILTSVKSFSNHAFWDIEGSVVVDKLKTTGLLKNIDPVQEPKKLVDENSEIIRLTNYGHIRLDQENLPGEHEEPSPSKDSLNSMNFIDDQFFGEHKPTQEVQHGKLIESVSQIKASDVPVDTNTVDQQYFYPNSKSEEEYKTILSVPPSASELEFKENEIDDQYFGEKANQPETSLTSSPERISAFTYLKSLQAKHTEDSKAGKQQLEEESSGVVPQKTYSEMMTNLYKLPNEFIVNLLKKSILYNKDGIVAISKPYGLVTTDTDGKADVVLTNFLPGLSRILRYEKLYTVHRLDRDTTGVLLLASNQDVANRLNELFLNHQIKKKYLAITKGIPNPITGTIDIPICERTVGERKRMALRPVLSHTEDPVKSSKYNSRAKSFKAITHFKVKRYSGSASFVELEPQTGVRHQLRVHMSEALSCPVLGDHKYSHDDKYAPQKLPHDMLDRLGIKQSKVRNVPMHLHAASISIPGFGEDGNDLMILSPLPEFFRYTLKKLKIDKYNKR